MSCPRFLGVVPRTQSLVCIAAIGFGLALGGCAAKSTGAQQASDIVTAGKPSLHSSADDPREPWSPSYGTRPGIEQIAPARTPAPVEAGSTRIATMDADALIRHAVAQHEMRRQ